ncbi:MAG: hypothetical protein WC867_00235 [Candidatus Pacearchaeota archaeon]|jgi:hypothetical protein
MKIKLPLLISTPFWKKIKTREDALFLIKSAAFSFFAASFLFIIFGLIFKNNYAFLDAGLYLILGLLIYFTKGRIISIIATIITFSAFTLTYYNKLRFAPTSKYEAFYVLLAAILFFISIKAVQASFKYKKLKK